MSYAALGANETVSFYDLADAIANGYTEAGASFSGSNECVTKANIATYTSRTVCPTYVDSNELVTKSQIIYFPSTVTTVTISLDDISYSGHTCTMQAYADYAVTQTTTVYFDWQTTGGYSGSNQITIANGSQTGTVVINIVDSTYVIDFGSTYITLVSPASSSTQTYVY